MGIVIVGDFYFLFITCGWDCVLFVSCLIHLRIVNHLSGLFDLITSYVNALENQFDESFKFGYRHIFEQENE